MVDAFERFQGVCDARVGAPGVELRDGEVVDVEQVEDGEFAFGVVAEEHGFVEVIGQGVGVRALVFVRVGGGVRRAHGQLFAGA